MSMGSAVAAHQPKGIDMATIATHEFQAEFLEEVVCNMDAPQLIPAGGHWSDAFTGFEMWCERDDTHAVDYFDFGI